MVYLPEYQRIVNDIKAEIESGALVHGDRLPSIREIRTRYRVSAQPVRTAHVVLRTGGWTEGTKAEAYSSDAIDRNRTAQPHTA